MPLMSLLRSLASVLRQCEPRHGQDSQERSLGVEQARPRSQGMGERAGRREQHQVPDQQQIKPNARFRLHPPRHPLTGCTACPGEGPDPQRNPEVDDVTRGVFWATVAGATAVNPRPQLGGPGSGLTGDCIPSTGGMDSPSHGEGAGHERRMDGQRQGRQQADA